MASIASELRSFFNIANAAGHRSDFAFSRDGHSSGEHKAATTRVSNAQDLGKLTLVSPARALSSSRAFDDEIRRLIASGLYPNASGTGLFPNPREYRNYKFGSCAVVGDNRQGECNWLCIPTLTPSDLDDCVKSYANLTANGLTISVASLFDWRTRDLILKNAGGQKAELDVWVCWPREDIPFTEDPGYDESYFYSDLANFAVPPVFKWAYDSTELLPQAGASEDPNASSDYKSVQARKYNDWNASPNENPWFRQFFKCDYRGNYKMVPGDEITFHWGTPNSQKVQPFLDLVINAGDLTDAYPYYNRYALMRRCGPQILIRVRGRLSHNELKAAQADSVNFGLFNIDYALITTQKWRPLSLFFDYTEGYRALNPAGSDPQDVNQALEVNSTQYHFVNPAEPPFNA